MLILALALLLPMPSEAWAPKTRVQMVDEAIRFMPPTLRDALQKNRKALLRGMLEPMKSEDSASHQPPWLSGSLEESVSREAAALAELLEKPTPFDQVAERFGALAHYLLDAGFPPGVGDQGASRYRHFSDFCESRRGRFPLVFYGHDHPALEKVDYSGYALDVMQRARDNDVKLSYTYERAADHGHSSDFDDRSVPFAVGSLSYSRSINDVVRVWLRVWEEAHGDMGFTPYRNMESASSN